jgi:hypothetical protein
MFPQQRSFYQDMLRKFTNIISYKLLPLLAILFFAVGIPMIHPVLHSHFEHRHISEGYNVKHSQRIQNEYSAHKCPLCDFLATSQLQNADSGPIIKTNELISRITLTNQIFLTKTCPFPTQPRAPPGSISL